MRQRALYILIAVLLILQIDSLAKISSLQKQVDNLVFSSDNLHEQIQNDLDFHYDQINQLLKQETSLIESASVQIGAIDASALAAPLTFSVTPKEISEYTSVSLELNGETFETSRNGTRFDVTIPYNIFGGVEPLIVINEGGVKKTAHDERLNLFSLKDTFFPAIFPSFSGTSGGGGDDGVYDWDGVLNLNGEKEAAANADNPKITFTKMHFVAEVDGKVISDEVIPAGTFTDKADVEYIDGWPVNTTVTLKDGQTCRLLLIAVDSIGLEHRYVLDTVSAGAAVPEPDGPGFGSEWIYDADGKLLWDSQMDPAR